VSDLILCNALENKKKFIQIPGRMKLPHQTTEGDLYELPVIFIQLVRPAAFIFSTASASAFAEQNEKENMEMNRLSLPTSNAVSE
jgi:hypothetical protein